MYSRTPKRMQPSIVAMSCEREEGSGFVGHRGGARAERTTGVTTLATAYLRRPS